jgi:uncharacterized membrane protein
MKALHLLSIVVWVGGMFFMHVCLRPAAAEALDPPHRLRLLQATMRRFFAVVTGAILIILASGAALVGLARGEALRAGPAFNMPLDWYAMIVLFLVMLAVFAHIRLVLDRRLHRARGAPRRRRVEPAL